MAKSKTKKSPVDPAKSDSPRLRPLNRKQKRQEAKKRATRRPALSGGFSLFKQSLSFIKSNAKTLGLITLVYLTLHLLFVRGLQGGISIQEIKDTINLTQDQPSESWTVLGIFGLLVGSGVASNNQAATIMQTILFIVVSLVVIWTMRQTFSRRKVGAKEAFYRANGPLVPFTLILAWMILQTIPFLVGSGILQFVMYDTLSGATEQLLAILLFVLLTTWTVYLLSSSLFALYIVTLPDMTPWRALRSAKQLVRFRRWAIIRKVGLLPLLIILIIALLVLPLIAYADVLAAPMYYLLAVITLPFAHVYIYHLYRELLR